jgi:hypothetical protein
MRRVEDALGRIAADLGALGRRFALVGGFAVSVRAEPRTTRDVDLAVATADNPDAEALVFALRARGYTVTATVEQTGVSRLATVRLSSPSRATVALIAGQQLSTPPS